MGLIFTTKYVCDKCGKVGMEWNCAFPKTTAMEIARNDGWQIGMNGWICPDCKPRKKEKTAHD